MGAQDITAPSDARLGFAPDYDAPIPYMQRTRDYYLAIGYTTPYRWAHYVDAPFIPLRKPLAEPRDHLSPRRRRPSREGRPGPRRKIQRRRQVLPVYSTATLRRRTICGSRTSPMTACTPPPTTAAPGFRCRNCVRLAAGGGSAQSRRASSAHRPIAATASRSRPTRRRSCALPRR